MTRLTLIKRGVARRAAKHSSTPSKKLKMPKVWTPIMWAPIIKKGETRKLKAVTQAENSKA